MSDKVTKKKSIRITVESTLSTPETAGQGNSSPTGPVVTEEGAARRRRRSTVSG